MPLVAPHLAFPIRVRAGRFLAVEQDTRRHREDQADVVLRTRPRTFDHDPELGLRDLVGELGPVAPPLLAAVADVVDGRFTAREATELQGRVRNVAVALAEQDGET